MDSLFYEFTKESKLTLAEVDVLGGLPKIVRSYIIWLENRVTIAQQTEGGSDKAGTQIKPLADCSDLHAEIADYLFECKCPDSNQSAREILIKVGDFLQGA